ncbi:PRC-barrel domain-containing protein [Oceaniglobus trochenteri]|uniref:PRC-barrel domain-containing protein n=1 Tax=Oceaniglobus trochenteri TaxID=2763260 RepID=UPI001CFFC61C|nr:PRC-barrel domain-containing protein [Oceaniglobus trochenteri]
MKPIMTTTALVALLATPALAQDNMADTPFYTAGGEEAAVGHFDLRASDLIGMRLYTSETEYGEEEAMDVSEDWNDVGEISDIILARDGSSEGVLLDIGGFLGIGERTVAVTMDKLNFVRDGDDAGDYFIVVTASQAQLDSAPEFDEESLDGWRMGTAMDPAPAEKTAAAGAPEALDDMDQRVALAADEVNSEELIGARVYDANDEWIGEVSELLISDDGKINEVVLDIGGFLGMGEHQVAMKMDELKLMHPEGDMDDVTVHAAVKGEMLNDLPEWEGKDK